MRKSSQWVVFAAASAVVVLAYAGTALRFGAPANVSQTPTPTEKAKDVRLAYQDGASFRKAWLLTYGDGPVGQQNVYAKYSFDEGATWSAPVLLSRDAQGAATAGQPIVTRNSLAFVADNDKPNIVAPPVTSGPSVVVSWTSSYCPQNPAAGNNAGSYNNPLQGAGDLNGDGTPERPYHCVWVATTQDPALAAWDVQQLTNGERDAIGDVVAANATGSAFALAWQEDPAGLQPGEAEGPGDGGSGATVSGGTNIWYTHAPAPNGNTMRANIAQVSDNNALGTGSPGASRPNLQISGSTAALAYEETVCAGGSGGRCIVYHSFAYANHDANSAGTIVSDPAKNSRRVRFALQGATAAGASNLRAVLLWRESPTVVPGAPADIVIRRGFVDTTARPGSTGFLASDILADAPQQMTNVAASGGNANAHRAIVRGGFVALAYDQTPSMIGADPERTATPSANYNLFITRSVADGGAGSWSTPVNLSGITTPSINVVEPRLVPTQGTVVNPLTGTPDAGDTQDVNVLYVSYGTEANTRAGGAGRIYVSRSTDQGASFEPFVPVSAATAGQSEAQLRSPPDGSSVAVLWMGEQTPGDTSTKDVMFAVATPVQVPDLSLAASDASFEALIGQGTVNLSIANHGTATASNVVLTATVPAGLTLVGISDTGVCSVVGAVIRCEFPEMLVDQSRVISLTLSSENPGVYSLPVSVSADSVESSTTDNTAVASINVTHDDDGWGCTLGRGNAPFDPSLWLLAGLAALGLVLRRVRSRKA